ncbi:MAG: radical SAM protein [Candidatus Micrarchaeota archaeon]
MDLKYACIINGVEGAYPGKAACVVVLGGSGLRTEFGFFGPVALAPEDCSEISVESLISHLNLQKANMEAVVFTGSEPLQQFDAIAAIMRSLKESGYLVKLETTGFYADKLESLLSYLDAVAMDIKTEFDADKYAELTGFRGEPATLMQDTLRSIRILKAHKAKNPNFHIEFRTTIIPNVNDTQEIVEKIVKEVPFADRYALQQFVAESKLADEKLRKYGSTPKIRLVELAVVAKKFIKEVVIRTKEEGEQVVE